MKIAIRVAVLILGGSLLFFGWHKAHYDAINLQNPGTTNTINSAEIFVVIGGFLALMSFLPSSDTLQRWASRKKPKPVPTAHFRRRRRT